ncbi:phytanoyl-CoA dioxygenase family protein [Rheinheimera baltica]|uniref:phytanoyl-CoA dioxygenase family protein n=1 Tax=Rheinheimera baltica TaxID=67576 RepID=UPI00042552A8|nr:phytanoyl-CoA dioxygenase family protein [Rheinheimera baltica]MDP5143179.1 phytanoyl-CoA dioxygenase family protein [Rheinheimera baltica]MDP5149890.1 phytanoyl-CoA dioxygenase family protein [Rheinheimera baltica]
MDSVEHFFKHGYVVVPNLLSAEKCAYFRRLLESNYTDYAEHYATASSDKGTLSDKSNEKVVFNLHNKSVDWFELFEHPRILAIVSAVLQQGSYQQNEPYYLNNISARCPLLGYPGQQLHIDSGLPGVNYCLKANVVWLLDDFTALNGATRIVPGSHNWTSFPPDGQRHPDEVLITGSQGSALIFNANLWHGGGANVTDNSRWALLLGYARWFIKPSFDFLQNTPDEIYQQLTDAQKRLLGFHLIPPKDEFTRLRRISAQPAQPAPYQLPQHKQIYKGS